MRPALLATTLLLLFLAPAAAGAQAAPARLVGVFDRNTDEPVAGAEIQLVGTGLSWRTSANGVAALANLPAGEHLLRVRRVGHRPHEQAITVSAADTVPITVMLPPAATELPAVHVQAEYLRNQLKLETTGFLRRRKASAAPPSAFWTREQLDSIKALQWTDVFRHVHGARVDGRDTPLLRCGNPMVILDGLPFRDGRGLADIPLGLVAGVELYSGASQVPPEFNETAIRGPRQTPPSGQTSLSGLQARFNRHRTGGNPGCVAVVWTR